MGQDKTEVLYTKAVIVSTKKKIFIVKRKYFQVLRCIPENISKKFFFFQIFGLYGKKISSMNT